MTQHRLLHPAAGERELLIAAVEHHGAGRLDQADALYGRVVRLNRRNPEALHRWALLKQTQGQPRDALQLLDRAIQVAPNQPLAHLHRGYILQDLGRRPEAVASLRRAVQILPDFVDAHIALGTVHAELGDIASACASFDNAARLDPRAVEPVLNKGILFEKHGRLDAAIETFDAALRIAPGDPNILLRKAACLLRQGDHPEALRLCDAALAARPDFAPAIFEKGLVLAESGAHQAAIVAFERAATLNHMVDACHYNIGNCLKRDGHLQAAVVAYRRAIALRPDYPEAFNNLGDALRHLRQPLDGLAALERAISIKPDYIDALINRAEALADLDRTAEAFAAYEHIMASCPDSADAFNSVGITADGLGRYEEALTWYAKALARDPRHHHAVNNTGLVLQNMARFDAALERFGQAIALKPDYADAHMNAARCRLQVGDFAGGWPLYEWRWKTTQSAPDRRSFSEPLWLGDSDIAGRTILVWSEQGFGDMLLSVRYVPLLAARGASVILQVPPHLQRLFARMPGIAPCTGASGTGAPDAVAPGTVSVVVYGAQLPAFDVQCPMMSLPLAFRTTLETIPADIPYLQPDLARVADWQQRLAALPGLKVGIVWAGSWRYPLDKRRSMKLAQMAPLGTVRDVSFVSLQKDAPAQQAREPPAGLTLHDWTDELHDFDDTAALVSALDLVIAVDSSIVHLTGGLGKPVWVLDRYDSEWRWLSGRDDSPWYPSLRLFRQEQPGDWSAVVERARAELERAGDDPHDR